MLAIDLINDEIPPLKTSDLGVKALNWMDEFKVTHLPIVKKNEYLGIISEDEIIDLNSPDTNLGEIKISLIRPFVTTNQHIYDVIKIITEFKVSVIAVLDDQQRYKGLIAAHMLVPAFSQLTAVKEPGGIIILELNINDYSLTQIAQIVEGNEAKILSCYVTPHKDSTKIEVTLKLNKEDLSAILQTFYRYNYTVKASFHQSEYDDDMKRKFESFMNYIRI